MQKFRPYLKFFANFYVLVGGLALVWMIFFDRHNAVDGIKTQSRIRQLEEDLSFYKAEKEELEATWVVLENEPDELERYARERYRMKKPNEDLFLIVDRNEK